MFNVTLSITLTLEGPLLSKSTSMGGHGIDAAMAKNYNGEYYLPYTLVKGRLLQAWQELHEVVDSEHRSLLGIDKPLDEFSNIWLGKKSGSRKDNGAVDSYRAKIIFSDFICCKKTAPDDILHRIKIDGERGAVEKGKLLMIEAPFAVGEPINFTGTVKYICKDEDEAGKIRKILEIGLRWIPSFGSERSVGFGRSVNVYIDKGILTAATASTQTTYNATGYIDIAITPDNPFCFARRQVSDNLFESDDLISGGAIKGALVSTWAGLAGKSGNIEVDADFDSGRRELSGNFHKIRITHAFPLPNDTYTRPIIPPLSLVKVKKKDPSDKDKEIEVNYDVAFQKDATLIDDFPYAPAFAVDWKNREDIDKIFGWEKKPDRELRIRTAMDRERRKAKDKELFAYEMVIPKGFKWVSRIDLSGITDKTSREKVESQIREVLSIGLTGMSKTKMSAKIDFPAFPLESKLKSSCAPIEKDGGKYWIITLQTPAILCNPANLNEASTSDDLMNAYKDAWSKLSGSTLELSHFFATQYLAGGYYLYKRFQDGKEYLPYLLTDAGSVFVFTAAEKMESDAQEKIEDWRKMGLELPDWAKKVYGKDGQDDGANWKNCPYIPENGYGEIAVNLHESYPQEIKVYEHNKI